MCYSLYHQCMIHSQLQAPKTGVSILAWLMLKWMVRCGLVVAIHAELALFFVVLAEEVG